MPTSIDVNNNPNFTTPSATPIPTSNRHGTGGRSTKNTSGTATSANRSAHSSNGGSSSSPTSITTKFSPQIAATATASSTWRIGIRCTSVAGSDPLSASDSRGQTP